MARYENRLILDEEQTPRLHMQGGKIATSHKAGSFGFTHVEAEADVVELTHQLDTHTEPVFVTRAMFVKLKAAFRELGLHRVRALKADKALVE